MTEEPYTNADLDAAENALVAAGSAQQAQALRQYTEGIRNLVQGEWGQSFVGALERITAANTKTVLAELSALRSEVSAVKGLFQGVDTRLSQIEQRLDRKRQELDEIQKRLAKLEGRGDAAG